MHPHVLIFAKTPYAKTPYDQWLTGSGITPLILVAEEYAEGYAHLPYVYSFRDYDRNLRVQQKALELVRTKNVKTVFARAESDILRAAELRDIAHIPGQNFLSALAYRNKIVMKNHLRNAGVLLPTFQKIESAYDIFEFIRSNGYPVVLKPTTESGSFGTFILRSASDLNEFLETGSAPGLDLQRMEIESFIEGQMYHVDGFVREGQLQFIQPSKYINDCLAFREDQYLGTVTVTPENPVYAKLVRTTHEVVAHLPSPRNFAFHCELWVRADGSVVFCEIASRTGGAMVGPMIEKTFGVHLDREWFLAECGLPGSPVKMAHAAGGAVWVPPQKGRLRALPRQALPAFVSEYQLNGREGQSYNGGVKSGLFLAGFVVTGANEAIIEKHVHEVAEWFSTHSVWE